MQNWSDLAQGSVADSVLVSRLVQAHVDSAARDLSVLVAGAHSTGLVAGLAQRGGDLSLLTRSVADGKALSRLVADHPTATVHCGAVAALVESGRTFDLVLALDDLDRLQTLELAPVAWTGLLASLVGLLSPGGTLLLGVENELGLHRLDSMRSRRAGNDDGDWGVLPTFDRSRPRSFGAAVDAAHGAGLHLRSGHALYADWLRPVLAVESPDAVGLALSAVIEVVATTGPALRHAAADPSRVVRASVAAGALQTFASGWVLELVAAGSEYHLETDSADEPNPSGLSSATVRVDTGAVVAAFTESEGRVVRRTEDSAGIVDPGRGTSIPKLGAGVTSFAEQFADACAAHDLPTIRGLMTDYASWLGAVHEPDEILDDERSAADAGGVVRLGEQWHTLLPGPVGLPARTRFLTTAGQLVALLRQRGGRHPWPASTEDATLVSILCAMSSVVSPEDASPFLPVPIGHEAHTPHTVAGLLSVVDRLEETVSALQGRAAWFERRLNEREQQLRQDKRARSDLDRGAEARQEKLRADVDALRSSLTWRVGSLVTAPVRRAAQVAKRATQ